MRGLNTEIYTIHYVYTNIFILYVNNKISIVECVVRYDNPPCTMEANKEDSSNSGLRFLLVIQNDMSCKSLLETKDPKIDIYQRFE